MADPTRTDTHQNGDTSQQGDTGEGLPDLPEPDHSLDCGMTPYYTAEQVHQAQREAVEADRKERDPMMYEWSLYIIELEQTVATLRAQQPAPLQQSSAEQLTDERINELLEAVNPNWWDVPHGATLAFARAIEAELASRGAAQGRNTSEESSNGR